MGCPEFHSVLGTRDKNGETAGTSLTVQWLRFRSPSAGGTGSIPGWKTKILHACRVWPKIKKKKKTIKKVTAVILKWIHLARGPTHMLHRVGSGLVNTENTRTLPQVSHF